MMEAFNAIYMKKSKVARNLFQSQSQLYRASVKIFYTKKISTNHHTGELRRSISDSDYFSFG